MKNFRSKVLQVDEIEAVPSCLLAVPIAGFKMVTFNCEVCNATVPKKNTEKHYSRCPDAYYTCIDCSKTFDDGYSYQKHTQCITEDEKYQKALYKGKKQKPKGKSTPEPAVEAKPTPEAKAPEAKPAVEAKPAKKSKKTAEIKLPKLEKGTSLYKILKTVKSKDTKKELLKRLVVTEQGHLVLQ
ncbi:hypothetical protein HG536_0A09390 [Torulaspora globosa]|uniref:C2H2-type domain-containing protein n=1 Tax=Torulaspora globosa TaxID=48254 RepID=A0A7G3ZC86_9SACH|nr:uncharacterized protein HG536_0A09390 [Torulaspora globosa]QLL31122.1 hypothetical protein HG536_0A09390 [Torulaspora globosa]